MEIFTNFSHVVYKFVVTKNFIAMVICLRVTCASSLFNASVEEKLIRTRLVISQTLYWRLVRLSQLRFPRCWRQSAAPAMKQWLRTQKILLKLVIRRVFVIRLMPLPTLRTVKWISTEQVSNVIMLYAFFRKCLVTSYQRGC